MVKFNRKSNALFRTGITPRSRLHESYYIINTSSYPQICPTAAPRSGNRSRLPPPPPLPGYSIWKQQDYHSGPRPDVRTREGKPTRPVRGYRAFGSPRPGWAGIPLRDRAAATSGPPGTRCRTRPASRTAACWPPRLGPS